MIAFHFALFCRILLVQT